MRCSLLPPTLTLALALAQTLAPALPLALALSLPRPWPYTTRYALFTVKETMLNLPGCASGRHGCVAVRVKAEQGAGPRFEQGAGPLSFARW